MRTRKTAYELARSQVETPEGIVRFVWKLTAKYRTHFARVLDLGAGDGRFAHWGHYDTYHGVEIDHHRVQGNALPQNASMHIGCAFAYPHRDYSLCIGNPPYVRHHDLDEEWRDKIAARFSREIGIDVNRKSNLYVYFMTLGLLKTSDDGLVSLLVPYEWASRPSTSALRRFIQSNRWHVDIYRFVEKVFGTVLTTASVSVIDKRKRDGRWCYHDVDANQRIQRQREVTLSNKRLLPYEERGTIWAMRGMSPGTQRIFTLTEGERVHSGLRREDVLPCVTSLRTLPKALSELTSSAFREFYIDAGERCWLIGSHKEPNTRLQNYLDHVPESLRATWTCTSREIWYRYELHPQPRLLVAAGFTTHGSKILINRVGAYAVGSVCGVHSQRHSLPLRRLTQYLRGIDFESRVVAHSGSLKKIEIRQFNAVLNRFAARYCRG